MKLLPTLAVIILTALLALCVASAASAQTDYALNKSAVASSVEDNWTAGVGPQYGNDGNNSTRWSSYYSDPQWWRVDLGQAYYVDRVWLNWTVAYAAEYRIEGSTDGTTYTTLWSGGATASGWKRHDWTPTRVRYLRVYGVRRATQYGYSFSDFQAYSINGTPVCAPITSWRAVGSPPLSDTDAAARVCAKPENRPANVTENSYRPSTSELSYYRSNMTGNTHKQYVTGNYTGTTDEIIQWTAHKWGIPEDVVRAQMVQESTWNQDGKGDIRTPPSWAYGYHPAHARIDSTRVYESLGMPQIKYRPPGDTKPEGLNIEAEPLRWKSTAFALDYYGAGIRFYYDGLCSWCGAGYSAGQAWPSIGAWYSPSPWWNSSAQDYTTRVQTHLTSRTWEKPGF